MIHDISDLNAFQVIAALWDYAKVKTPLVFPDEITTVAKARADAIGVKIKLGRGKTLLDTHDYESTHGTDETLAVLEAVRSKSGPKR